MSCVDPSNIYLYVAISSESNLEVCTKFCIILIALGVLRSSNNALAISEELINSGLILSCLLMNSEILLAIDFD